MMSLNMRRTAAAVVATAALSLTGFAASAVGSVGWLNPANNSSFPVGTMAMPDGQANASGTIGGGLDLMLVLDSSGSMGASVSGTGKTRQQIQQEAANALVNGLPAGSNVGVVDFDSSASVVQPLTTIPDGAVNAAINGINASGGTDIASGINAAVGELNANGTPTNSQQILVISDGSTFPDPAPAAAAAAAAGYTVNSVAFPGANLTTMQDIASSGGGTFVNFTNNPQDIVNIFSGAGGGVLVGVSSVDITDPDGNTYAAAVDAIGNFKANAYNLKLGNNMWTALATFTDGSTATATWNLIGTAGGTNPVPVPPSMLLMASGLIALGVARRRRKAA
ncbi:MAG: VWA domain-containing protein [Pseudomonadota bacterium]